MNQDRKKELDALLNANSEDEETDTEEEDIQEDKGEEEDEETDTKDSEEETDEDEETDEEESDDGESDDSDDEEETEEDAGGEASKQKNKWHGKSREEVIRMYEELETKNQPPKRTKAKSDSKKENDEGKGEGVDVPNDEELAKMTPKQFAEWMVTTVQSIVGKTYDARSRMRDSAAQEIREAQKDHPLLKTSPEYRELVLSLIDAASQKGTVMPLKEACAKVDGFAGKVKGDTKVSDTEKIRLKKAKAQVERGVGAPTSPGEEKGAEERRLENIFGTSGSNGPLGGLGV